MGRKDEKMKCNNCGKIITLSDLDSYNFMDENNQLIVKCRSCENSNNKINEKSYPVGVASLGSAALLLAIFFTFNNLIFGLITIILAIFAIFFQLSSSKNKERQI